MQLSTPLDQRILRVDKVTLNRWKFCGRVRKNIFHKWEQKCDYYFEIKEPSPEYKAMMKEFADKNMVIRARWLP